MKVLHVTPSFYPAHVYGGPIECVYSLCRNLARLGCEIRVLTTDANGSDAVLDVEKGREMQTEDGLRVRYCRRIVPQSTSVELGMRLNEAVKWADVVHLTAIYNFPSIPTLLAANLHRRPVVWSPHGSLDTRVGRKRWLKPTWQRLCESVCPRKLTFHVTSEQEQEDCQKAFPGYQSAMIPNGVDVPEVTYSRCRQTEQELRILHMGRYDPKKAIENLLVACARLKESGGPNWRLMLAGREQGPYAEYIRNLIPELGIADQTQMVGEVTGDAKERLFAWADVLVLPSHSENFGMVVVEALARGLPVITSRRTPWRKVEEVGCGLWVDNSPEELSRALKKIREMPLATMGENGRRWMLQSYSWRSIAEEMSALYSSMAN